MIIGALLGGSAGGVLAIVPTAPAAHAATAGSFTTPSPSAAPYTVPTDATGNPKSFDVAGTGFAAGSVYLEICDGVPQSLSTFDPNVDCDAASAGSSVQSSGPSATESFPASNSDVALVPFRGDSPSGQFNCLAKEDVKAGTSPGADGSVTPIGSTTLNGDKIDTSVPSWTNCQLRLSSSDFSSTSDQTGLTITIPNSGTRLASKTVITPQSGTATVGSPTTITATVSGTGVAPTGSVSFTDRFSGTNIPLSDCQNVPVTAGVATCTTSHILNGANGISGAYSGDAVYAVSTSPLVTYTATKPLIATTTAISSTPAANTTPGNTVALKATVTPASGTTPLGGTVNFENNGTTITGCGAVPISGTTASCTTPALSAGTESFTAIYSGDSNYSGSTSSAEPFTVASLPTPTVAVSFNPATSTYGTAEAATATVTAPSGTTGTPTGMVSFSVTPAGSTTAVPVAACQNLILASGAVTCPALGTQPAGADTVTATYNGDTAFSGATGNGTLTITKATPTVSLAPTPASPVFAKQSVTLTATIGATTGTPGGTVDFKANGTDIASCTAQPITSGQATCITTALPTGSDTLTAVYSGDTNFVTVTSSSVPYTVNPQATTTTTLTSDLASPQKSGTTVTFTATVAPAAATGTVTFTTSVGGNSTTLCSAVALTSGTAMCPTAKLPVGANTVTATYNGDTGDAGSSGTEAYTVTAPPGGYWLTTGAGAVTAKGGVSTYGDASNLKLAAPVVGITSTSDGKGYWLVAADGGVLSYGDAGFFGSAGGLKLAKPVVGMVATSDGKGYWLVAADGGVLSYGDAPFVGSAANLKLAAPVVGIARNADNTGIWLTAADGGVFAYGKARFFGSAATLKLAKPVVGIQATPDGGGYYLVGSDGGIFSYGDAPFDGSIGGKALASPVVGLSLAAEGGYRLAQANGTVTPEGSATDLGANTVTGVVGITSPPAVVQDLKTQG